MFNKMFFCGLCAYFFSNLSVQASTGLNHLAAVSSSHVVAPLASTNITGKWMVTSRVRSSLLHGEKSSRKETYKNPVIYDFTSPNILKVTQDGKVSTYKYKINNNNEIVIVWTEPMAIEAIHGPTDYKIKRTGDNKIVLVHELPSAAPNYYRVSINLEQVK